MSHGGGASKYWQGMSLIVILLTLGLAGCAEENCQFESDCATGQSCIEGPVFICVTTMRIAGQALAVSQGVRADCRRRWMR